MTRWLPLSLILLLAAATADSGVVRVPSEQPDVQAGIDEAQPADTVLVAAGTYNGPGNQDIDFRGKAVTVLSESGPDLTFIDCQGSVADPHRAFVFDDGEDSTSVLCGFTITGGYIPETCDGCVGPGRGGGIYGVRSGPRIESCVFTECRAELYGGAVCFDTSDVLIVDCLFANDSARLGGGLTMIGNGHANVQGCNFVNNVSSNFGGGAYFRQVGDITIYDCQFVNNQSGGGAGVDLFWSSASLVACTFRENEATRGAGLEVLGSRAIVDSCDFQFNRARAPAASGRAAASRVAAANELSSRRNALIDPAEAVTPNALPSHDQAWSDRISNRLRYKGGAIWAGGIAFVAHCLFEGNSADDEGGAIYGPGPDDTLQLVSCLFKANVSEAGGAVRIWGRTALFDSCTFSGNAATGWGGAVLDVGVDGSYSNCCFAGNSLSLYRGSGIYFAECSKQVDNCTFTANHGGLGGVLACDSASPTVANTIISFSPDGKAVHCYDSLSNPQFACSDIFGNAGGDWIECIEDQADSNGNMSLDPLFCDTAGENMHIYDSSPCAPDNNPCSQLIGAFDVACVCCDSLRGNVDWDPDDRVNIVDLTYLIAYLFGAGSSPLCPEESNVDGDPGGSTNIVDLTHLVAFLFGGGPPPQPCP